MKVGEMISTWLDTISSFDLCSLLSVVIALVIRSIILCDLILREPVLPVSTPRVVVPDQQLRSSRWGFYHKDGCTV